MVTMGRASGARLVRRLLLVLLLGGGLVGCNLGPRPTAIAVGVAQAPDSALQYLLDAVREDQKNFEVYRRSTFPFALPILSGSFTCTEQLGLYCIDRVAGGLARIRAGEDSTLIAAREDLIETLQLVNGRVPSDGWVQGQLVRYLVEAGNLATAASAAAACRAEPAWWCFALAGYVYHRSGYSEPAEEAFRVALTGMPPEERAHWLDLAPILDPETAELYVLLEEEGATYFEEAFWRLADPLLTRPGNELFTEHMARHVELAFQLEAETVEGPLNDRLALETIGRYDLTLRYGQPARWSRGLGATGMVQVMSLDTVPCRGINCRDSTPADIVYTARSTEFGVVEFVRGVFEARRGSSVGPGMGLLAPPRGVRDLIASYEVRPQDLLPPPGFLRAYLELDSIPEGEVEEEWDRVREVRHPGYSIQLFGGEVNWIAPLAHQMAVFPRGDTVAVVAGWDLTAHGFDASTGVEGGVALLSLENLFLDPVMSSTAGAASGAVVARIPARPSLVSVEAALPDERAMARARYELDLQPRSPMRVAISDLLLLHGTEEEINTLDEAVAVARGSYRVRPGEVLGAYWEIYGLDPETSPEIRMSLALHRPAPGVVGGLLRRLGEAVGVIGEETPVRTEWVEEVVAGPWMGRSVTLRIPDLTEGRYTLVLTATVPGREPMVVASEIEVTRSVIEAPRTGTLVRRPQLTRPTGCLPETAITTSAFLVEDAADYFRTPRCVYSPDPSWFGHYGGAEHPTEYGYDGW